MGVEIELREAWTPNHARLLAVEEDRLSAETPGYAWQTNLTQQNTSRTDTDRQGEANGQGGVSKSAAVGRSR